MTEKTNKDLVEVFNNGVTQYVARNVYGRNDRYDVVNHPLIGMNHRAALAEKLLSHFGIIAGQDGGEDSAGRQALKLMEPWEVVDRACTIADRFWDELDRRGWIDRLPTMEEIAEKYHSSQSAE